MNSFQGTLAIGKKIEKYAISFLRSLGHTVIDHSDDKSWQNVDTDFEVRMREQKTTLEVKADSKIHEHNNFFFEEGFDRATGYYAGWFDKCEAEHICFIDYVDGKGYILRFDKALIKNNAISRKWYNRTDNCQGYALLLNCDRARELGLVALEWVIEDPIN